MSRLALCVVVGLLMLSPAAEAQTDPLKPRVEQDLTPPQWQALLSGLKSPAERLHAHRLRCMHLLDRVDAQARAEVSAVVAQGLLLATKLNPGDAADEAGLQLCKGAQAEAVGHFNEASSAYDRAVQLASLAHDDDLLGQALVVRGSLHYSRGAAHKALVDLLDAYRLASLHQDQDLLANALNSLANLYASRQLAQYDKALEYFRDVLRLSTLRNKPADVATSYFNLGTTLVKLKRFAEARDMLDKALASYQALNDAGSVGETQRERAGLSIEEKDYAGALALADAAVRAARVQQDGASLALAQLTRAAALRHLGRLVAAARDLDTAAKSFEAENNPRAMERLLSEQADVFAGQKLWERAYRARTRQYATQQQLTREQRDELSASLRIGFDTERKEQENAALQRDAVAASQIRRLQSALIVLGALLLAGVGAVAWRQARQARQMRTLALSDELTGLPNRRAVLDELRRRLATDTAVPILIFDIDHFKRINDRLGHDVGDRVLRDVASACRGVLAPSDVLGRIGGEEFLVLLGHADLSGGAEALRQAVRTLAFDGAAGALAVTISLGGTRSLPGEVAPETLLKRADLALYEAKEGGRDRTVIRD